MLADPALGETYPFGYLPRRQRTSVLRGLAHPFEDDLGGRLRERGDALGGEADGRGLVHPCPWSRLSRSTARIPRSSGVRFARRVAASILSWWCDRRGLPLSP